jgi:DNA mismatch repair protein MutS
MTIYTDYTAATNLHKKEYGDRTIVFYQVGSFYELYSTDNNLAYLKEVTELLNIQLTRKNKSQAASETNYNMAGIPMHALHKYLKLLTNANYTVVIYEQVEKVVHGKLSISRKIAEIISPGTNLDNADPFKNNIIMVAHIEAFIDHRTRQSLFGVGVCFLDLTTGRSYIGEYVSTPGDPNIAFDELYKNIVKYAPREVILLSARRGPTTTAKEPEFEWLINYLDINKQDIAIHNKIGLMPSDMEKIVYQENILCKVFPEHGLITIHEYVGVEQKQQASIALVYMLDFCYSHNEHILRRILPPQELTLSADSNTCTIAYNAAQQLGLDQLAKILNRCKTAIGRRSFKEMLYTPLADAKTINNRYGRVEAFINIINSDNSNRIASMLNDIYDIERIYRQICLLRLNPADISQVVKTIQAVRDLNRSSSELRFSKIGSAKRLQEELSATLELESASRHMLNSIEDNFFAKGIYPELDDLQNKLNMLRELPTKIAACLHPEYFKVEYTERDGYFLRITKKRYALIKTTLLQQKPFTVDSYVIKWEDFDVKPTIEALKCSSDVFAKINEEATRTKTELCECVKKKYRDYLHDIATRYGKMFVKMADYIREIDWFYSCATVAIEYRYYRPTIIECDSTLSYLRATEVRHPIIERILTQEEYVTNDVALGSTSHTFDNIIPGEESADKLLQVDTAPEPSGILLYGVNSAGKSSLSKAIALIVIMAQVGMYVPAHLTYWPYKEIFTRIPSGDDIMKGKSTFVVEITELGNILKRATSRSLVIGDELASGTESVSAISIVGAGIVKLCAQQTSFIFATHLHDLVALTKVKELIASAKLAIYHLAVTYDEDIKALVYRRKLTSGQGDTIYGLEVCKALNLDLEFLNIANELRHEVLGHPAVLCKEKKSQYNAATYIDICKICGSNAVEVHHINQQMYADAAGYIGHIHKNHRTNLIAICEKCHDAIHAGKVTIDGYRQTTRGARLLVKKTRLSA